MSANTQPIKISDFLDDEKETYLDPKHYSLTLSQRRREKISADILGYEANGGIIQQVAFGVSRPAIPAPTHQANRDALPENIMYCQRDLVYKIRIRRRYTGNYESLNQAINALNIAMKYKQGLTP